MGILSVLLVLLAAGVWWVLNDAAPEPQKVMDSPPPSPHLPTDIAKAQPQSTPASEPEQPVIVTSGLEPSSHKPENMAPQTAEHSSPGIADSNPSSSRPAPPVVTRKRPVSPADQARLAQQAAQEALQTGRVETAVEQLQQTLRLQPQWPEPRTQLAQVYLQLKQENKAQVLLAQGLQINPGSATWAMMLARLMLSQQAITPAIQVLETARDAGSNDINLDLFLAALYQRSQRLRDAAELYQAVLARDAQHGKAWLGLAIVLEGLGQPLDALSAFRQAQRSGGHSAEVQSYIQQRIADLST